MAAFVKVELECDAPYCKAKGDGRMRIRGFKDDIPLMDTPDLPAGWTRGWPNYDGETPYHCPEHDSEKVLRR